MRTFVALLSFLLCVGCSLEPHAVPPAPSERNLAVVFDIDGTLTTDVHAIRDTRQGAVAAVRAYADGGYRIIYLSARHPLLQWHIPTWLAQHGFPEGPVHVTETPSQRRDHAAFKQGVLDEYRASGWALAAAYGDSSTDFDAYRGAGIDRDHVFALRREGAKACEPGAWSACYAGWPEQMTIIDKLIRAQGQAGR
ncbi:MAG: hypothetical protein P8Y52_00890 [Xanthomonadales bacterium]